MKHIREYKKLNFGHKYHFEATSIETDSIKFIKQDDSEFTDREIDVLIKELNDLLPEGIEYELDGVYTPQFIVKAKNYAYIDKDKKTIKGSGLKCTMKSSKFRVMIQRFIDATLGITDEVLEDIYNEYIIEVSNLKDISAWCSKKTVTKSVLNPKRTTEQKLLDAIQGKGLQEGDKFFVFFKPDDSIALLEDFDGEYHVDRLYKSLYNNVKTFETVFDVKTRFPNYSLKKNKKALEELLNELY